MSSQDGDSIQRRVAMRGALTELGVLNLMHMLQEGRKTGELILIGNEQCAKIYFVDGNLVHAASEDQQGFPVIQAIADWAQGEFEFRPGVQQDQITILNELEDLIQAEKPSRSARAAEPIKKSGRKSQVTSNKKQPGSHEEEPVISEVLTDFVSATPFTLGAWVIDQGGVLKAAARGTAVGPKILETLRTALCCLVSSYPRESLRRIILEDEEGQVVFQRLDDEHRLLVVVGRGAAPGAVSVAVSKLANTLAGEASW
jgi:hypothetical protein